MKEIVLPITFDEESGSFFRDAVGNEIDVNELNKKERKEFGDHIAKCVNDYSEIMGGGRIEIRFDKGDYRVQYSDDGNWCAFDTRTGKYVGDPERFHPLRDLVDLIDLEVLLERGRK